MKKISQRDIAKTLGVNVSSVSRALKGQKGVSEELRQKIERMAAENGYQPMDLLLRNITIRRGLSASLCLTCRTISTLIL